MFKAIIFSKSLEIVTWSRVFETEEEAWEAVGFPSLDNYTVTVNKLWEKPKGKV